MKKLQQEMTDSLVQNATTEELIKKIDDEKQKN